MRLSESTPTIYRETMTLLEQECISTKEIYDCNLG